MGVKVVKKVLKKDPSCLKFYEKQRTDRVCLCHVSNSYGYPFTDRIADSG